MMYLQDSDSQSAVILYPRKHSAMSGNILVASTRHLRLLAVCGQDRRFSGARTEWKVPICSPQVRPGAGSTGGGHSSFWSSTSKLVRSPEAQLRLLLVSCPLRAGSKRAAGTCTVLLALRSFSRVFSFVFCLTSSLTFSGRFSHDFLVCHYQKL